MGREQIFYREAERLEYRDLAIILPSWKLAQFRRNVSSRPTAFGDPHHYIARLFERSGARVNYQSRSLN